MQQYYNYNGKLFEQGTAMINPDNRAFRYGDGIFETMRILNGDIVNEDLHFTRLYEGILLMDYQLPKLLTPQKLIDETYALAQKNKSGFCVRVRLTIFRGDGGLYDYNNKQLNYCIQTWPMPETNMLLNANGLQLGYSEAAKKPIDAYANIKHNNYLPYVIGALLAKKNKWNDAIILNTNGNICDTTIANIFIVKDNIIYTPALTEGCVEGTIRQKIIETAEYHNIELKETIITKEMVSNADEVFTSNSSYKVRWVKSIDKVKYQPNLVLLFDRYLH